MSNLNSVFDPKRGWPEGSALEDNFRPDPNAAVLTEGLIVKTENRQLASVDILKIVDDTLVTSPALLAANAGNAYVVAGVGGAWATFNIGDIVEWSGTAWAVVVPAVEAEVAVGTRAVVTGATAAGSFTGEEEKVLQYTITGVQATLALGNVAVTNATGYLELTQGLGNVDLTQALGNVDVTCALGNIALTCAIAAYTNCDTTDIGKTVTGSLSADTGTLISYDNATRIWQIAPTDAVTDTFQDGDILTITTGIGGGTVDGGGTALIANAYVPCIAGDIGKVVTGAGTGDTGVLIAYDNATRIWQIAPTDAVADTFAAMDVLSIAAGTGAGIVTGNGAAVIDNAYVNCIAGDIGKVVTGSVTGDTGILIAYDNGTRVWSIAPTDAVTDTFGDGDVLSIAAGTGAGIVTGGGTALIANAYVSCIAGDVGKVVTGSLSGHTGTLVAYDNVTRIWQIVPTNIVTDLFQDADVLTIAAGTGTGIVTGLGTGLANAYVPCIVGDVGKVVTGSVTGDTGVLISYDNGTRIWNIAPTDAVADTFGVADILTIAAGTGSGVITIGGVVAIANAYVNCVAGDVGKPVVGTGSGDTGNLVSYNNTTRVWVIDPDTPADVFATADTLAITGGTGAGMVTGGGISGIGGAWSSTVPVNDNRVLISDANSIYYGDYYDYIGTHPAGGWYRATNPNQKPAPVVMVRATSGAHASTMKDDVWVVIQGNDQWDAAFVDQVTCLKLESGCAFQIAHTAANTLIAGVKVQANNGVLEAYTTGWPIGVVIWSNGTAGATGKIVVSTM